MITIENQMREAMQEFVDRVERGEVRSRYTYERFKEILANTSAPSPAAEGAKVAQVEGDCPHCKGSGEMEGLGGSGPDTYSATVNCSACCGTGNKPAEVLGDEQLKKLHYETLGYHMSPMLDGLKFARAIERAVLAQQKGCTT